MRPWLRSMAPGGVSRPRPTPVPRSLAEAREEPAPAPVQLPTVSAALPSPPPAPTFLRLSAGFVYFYFGFLKFFPDLSPAEMIASQTLMRISFHWLDAKTALLVLAVMESAIGLAFLFNVGLRWVFFLFLFHQVSTFIPLFIFPEITFKIAPFAPTMEGQYIFKNLISLAAGWTVMLPAVRAGWAHHQAERARRRAAGPVGIAVRPALTQR